MERIYHTWDKWECYPAGFYESKPKDKALSEDDCREAYRNLLRDTPTFEAALERVLNEWPRSCEHYLTNENMNRLAWLGQASLCIALGIPSEFRGGYSMLTADEKKTANKTALKYLNIWMERHGHPKLTMDDAKSKTEMNLY